MSLALVHQLRIGGGFRQWTLGICARAFSESQAPTTKLDFKDFNNVRKEIYRINEEQGLEKQLPSTQLLKELGHEDLIRAIRKKHGGFHEVAERLGWPKDDPKGMHNKLRSRQNRRTKRKHHLARHHIFKE